MSNPSYSPLSLPAAAPQVAAQSAGQNVAQPARRAAREIAAPATSVEQAIANAAQSTSVDFDYLVAQAQVESAMNPDARARTSSASGLYQFIESTWLDTMKRHGPRFGFGDIAAQIGMSAGGSAFVADPLQRSAILAMRNDPQVASLMAAGLAEDNRSALIPILGRQPDHSELYLAHFLGAGGAGRFLSAMQSDPGQSAAALFRRPAAANRAVFYEASGAPRTLAGVMDFLSAKLERAGAAPRSAEIAGYARATALSAGVPYLITAEEVFEPRNPPLVTAPPTSLGLPPRSAPPTAQPSSGRAMSELFSGGVSEGAPISSQSAEQVRRAYARLRALGL
ncbi:MAG: transglycosylase SLT domain-containing protein [Pseudomonadota bacterium]